MKRHSLTKRILSMVLALVVIITILPAPVSAASVSLNPKSGGTIFTGASFTMKVKGTYKKVSWSSTDSKVLTISKKGVVTAKKPGWASVKAVITLKNSKKVTKYCDFEVEQADKIVKVTEANETVAKTVHGYLTSNTPFSLVVTGKEKDATAVVAKLQKLVGKQNEYGVIFQYNEGSSISPDPFPEPAPNNKGWLFHVTKDDCKLYNYAVSFYKRIATEIVEDLFWDDIDANDNFVFFPDGKLTYARSFSTWQEYEAALEADNSNSKLPNSCQTTNARQCWLVANKKFCDLSQAMQVWVVSKSGYFGGGITPEDRKASGAFGMSYACADGKGKSFHETDLTQMKNMATNVADGTCGDFANYEVTALKQLGIKAKYASGAGHAWSIVYPYNADGKKLTYEFDWYLRYGKSVSLTSDTEDMIY